MRGNLLQVRGTWHLMKHYQALKRGGRKARALLVSLLCLLLSATAAAAQEVPRTDPLTCIEVPRQIAEIEHWLKVANEAETEAASSARPSDPDNGCLRCHGDAGRLIEMVTPPERRRSVTAWIATEPQRQRCAAIDKDQNTTRQTP